MGQIDITWYKLNGLKFVILGPELNQIPNSPLFDHHRSQLAVQPDNAGGFTNCVIISTNLQTLLKLIVRLLSSNSVKTLITL